MQPSRTRHHAVHWQFASVCSASRDTLGLDETREREHRPVARLHGVAKRACRHDDLTRGKALQPVDLAERTLWWRQRTRPAAF
jgi:hypothetical protein